MSSSFRLVSRIRHTIPEVLEDAENELTELTRQLIAELYARLLELDRQVADYEHLIEQLFRESPVCQRMQQVEGVGVLTSTALVARWVMQGLRKRAADVAWLGLVPRTTLQW